MPVLGVGNQASKIKNMLEAKYTFATTLLAILLDSYGTEFFDWEPLSLRHQIKDDFGATMPEINENKVWALVTALTTNQFYKYWEIFSQTCRVLNNDEPDFADFTPVDPEDLAWGVAEVLINDPPDKEMGNEEFSHEISSYAGIILYENGIWQPPKVLDFADIPVDKSVSLESAFVDDADMFAASQLNQTNRSKELTDFVKEKLGMLKQQLLMAPLTNRSKDFEAAVQKQYPTVL